MILALPVRVELAKLVEPARHDAEEVALDAFAAHLEHLGELVDYLIALHNQGPHKSGQTHSANRDPEEIAALAARRGPRTGRPHLQNGLPGVVAAGLALARRAHLGLVEMRTSAGSLLRVGVAALAEVRHDRRAAAEGGLRMLFAHSVLAQGLAAVELRALRRLEGAGWHRLEGVARGSGNDGARERCAEEGAEQAKAAEYDGTASRS